MKSLKERENELFEEWLRKQPLKDFAFDGVVNENSFNNFLPRLVFVLKDTNGGTGHWSLSDLIARGNYAGETGTWYPIAKWLARLMGEDVPANDVSEKARLFQRIAVVNLKKTPGKSRSSKSAVKDFVRNDINRSFLIRQFELYMDKPTVFACCGKGVMESFEYCIKMSGIKTGLDADGFVSLGDNCLAFGFRHPNCSSNAHADLFTQQYEKAKNKLK